MSYTFTLRGIEIRCDGLDELEAALERYRPVDDGKTSEEASAYLNDLRVLGAEQTTARREHRTGPRRNPENVPNPGDHGLTPRERQIADLMLTPAPEARKQLKEAAAIMGIGYEMARQHRASAVRKLALSSEKLRQEKYVAPERPREETEAKADRDLAAESGAESPPIPQGNGENVRITPEGIERRGSKNLMGWEDPYFTMITWADPAFQKSADSLWAFLGNAVDVPREHRGAARGFRMLSREHRFKLVRSAKNTIESWRRTWDLHGKCFYCEGMGHRRPCPGICPVCEQSGERELLERPETLHSSAGLIDGEE